MHASTHTEWDESAIVQRGLLHTLPNNTLSPPTCRAISPRQAICFSIPRVKPALTELPKQYFKCPPREDTLGFVQLPIHQKKGWGGWNPCLYVPASPYPLIIRPRSRNNIPHFATPALHSLPCATSRIHPHSLIPPSSFLKATCSQPVWLSCTLPMKGFLLGWDWVQPSRALAGSEAEAGASFPSSSTPTATPHACSGLALSPRSRLLVSAVPNCLQQQKRARTRERVGTMLACWAVTRQARTQRFVLMLPRFRLCSRVIFMKMDVVFFKCQWVVSFFLFFFLDGTRSN